MERPAGDKAHPARRDGRRGQPGRGRGQGRGRFGAEQPQPRRMREWSPTVPQGLGRMLGPAGCWVLGPAGCWDQRGAGRRVPAAGTWVLLRSQRCVPANQPGPLAHWSMPTSRSSMSTRTTPLCRGTGSAPGHLGAGGTQLRGSWGTAPGGGRSWCQTLAGAVPPGSWVWEIQGWGTDSRGGRGAARCSDVRIHARVCTCTNTQKCTRTCTHLHTHSPQNAHRHAHTPQGGALPPPHSLHPATHKRCPTPGGDASSCTHHLHGAPPAPRTPSPPAPLT